MQALLKHNEGEIRYEVFFDKDGQYNIFKEISSMAFMSEKEKEEFRKQFINGDLCAFGVVKYEVCKCCCMWSEKDSLWGIHAESAEEALDYYKNY